MTDAPKLNYGRVLELEWVLELSEWVLVCVFQRTDLA
jgi:hypothetical protein